MVTREITRGFATIVRTEGHRIQEEAADDARNEAHDRRCDVLKQWDSTLDDKTRPTHRQLDGQIREIGEPFTVGSSALLAGVLSLLTSLAGLPECKDEADGDVG